MSAPLDEPEATLWAVTATDGNRTLVVYVVDAPSGLIARSLAIIQMWQLALDGAPINVLNLDVLSVERVDEAAE